VRWLALPLVFLLAACTAPPAPAADPETPSPFKDCAGLASGSSKLPELSLPCFTGGAAFALTTLRGPAVINMWASWCGPCRDELPVMQRLFTSGKIKVVGVDVGDDREAAASFGAARGVTFPTLYDRDRRLLAALGRSTLPVTVFVDAAGQEYVHPMPVDEAELAELVREHAGVAVTR
jgi:cytochrome c biogenesis protein CcmG/thiol:disulfide interchange protein DsbE